MRQKMSIDSGIENEDWLVVLPEEKELAAPDWSEIRRDTNLKGDLNDTLRQKIQGLSCAKPLSNLTKDTCSFVDSILNTPVLEKNVLAPALNSLYEQKAQFYQSLNIPKPLRTRQYICGSGLILSPDHCVTTIRDSLRVGLFLKGVDAALKQLAEENFGEPLHIVYPACGPFAPLLLPLLTYYKNQGIYSPDEINVTFIDIQEGAAIALDALVKQLGLQEYVRKICCMEACEYQVANDVHMVILEAMQHGFSREGHLRLAKHFADLLHPNGIFLPQNIAVTASLSSAQREYVDQWKTDDMSVHGKIRNERIELGKVLEVNLEFLRAMQEQVIDEHTRIVECSTLSIPYLEPAEGEKTLLFHTRVNVFGEDWLGEYESGITHPLPDSQVCVNFIPHDLRPGDLLVGSGDSLTFYYCMNGLPGFLTTKSDHSGGDRETILVENGNGN